MSFSSATFIATYAGTDKVIRFQNTNLEVVGGFNVCTFDNLAFEGPQLWVSFNAGEKLILEFTSQAEAKAASDILRAAVDALYTNCALVVPGPPIASVVVPISLAAFNVARLANTLVAPTAYQISDSFNAFGLPVAGTFNVIADAANSYKLRGVNTVDGTFVELDFVTNKIVNYHDPVGKNTILGDASLFTTTGLVTNVYGKSSTIIANVVDNVNAIDSVVTISNAMDVAVEKSNVILATVSNLKVYGVIQDLSAYPLNDVVIDTRSISNKLGEETLTLVDDLTLSSFVNTTKQFIPVLGTNLSVRIDNIVPSVVTQFAFVVPATLGAGLELTIKDAAGVPLFVINDKYANQTIVFTWDTVLLAFVAEYPNLPEFTSALAISFNGQTSFVDVLPYTLTTPSNTQLYVNGQRVKYSVDYTITNRTLTWISSDYSLETDDVFVLNNTGK